MIIVDVELTYSEYRRAIFSVFLRRYRWILAGILLVVVALLIDNILLTPDEIPWKGYIYPLAFFGFLLVSPYFSAKSVWKHNPVLAERKRYTLTDEVFRVESLSVFVENKWSNFLKMTTTRDFFLLFVSEAEVVIIPISSFASSADREVFQHFVLTHLSGEKASLLKSSKRRKAIITLAIWLVIIIFVVLIMMMKK